MFNHTMESRQSGPATIALVDDVPERLDILERYLGPERGVVRFDSARDLLAWPQIEGTGLVIGDIQMPEMDGIEMLQILTRRYPELPVVLMTSHGSVEQAVECVKAGAYDYLTWPFETEQLHAVVRRALEKTELLRKARDLEARLMERNATSEILGESSGMRVILGLIRRVSRSEITVLVTGETGTGKELVSAAIHDGSRRSRQNLVPINCGALPRELLESELFGHAQGAFTGAKQEKRGLVEEAHLGTLFLDEVGELPLDLQVKLNRFLQEGEVRPVGATAGRKVDVRVIAATNRNLKSEVTAGRFREDLFYRISTFPIHLPPLRDRRDDIPLLAHRFLQERARQEGKSLLGFEPPALARLTAYSWPGNVRELEAVVARAVVLETGQRVATESLPEEITGTQHQSIQLIQDFSGRTYREVLDQGQAAMGRAYLQDLMRRNRGNVRQSSQEAGVGRETLHRLLRKHGVAAAPHRKAGGELSGPGPSRTEEEG